MAASCCRFTNNPICFYKELTKSLVNRKVLNFVINYDENELNTDDIDVADLFNEKIVIRSKSLAD